MEVESEWYQGVTAEISRHKGTLTEKDSRKYRVDLLQRLAKRVDYFSPTCEIARRYQPEIDRLAVNLGQLPRISKPDRKNYFETVGRIGRHLHNHHSLVTKWYYVRLWPGIATAIGVVAGSFISQTAAMIGLAVGIAAGAVIGLFLDAKARKDGRVI